MASQRGRKRIKSRVDELPDDMREILDQRLADVTITYREIAEEFKLKGYIISKSSIGRYALRQGAALNRLKEAQEQTKVLINAVKTNPDVDYTEAGLQILMDALIKKISTAQEEIEEMPPDKAGRLMVAISRTDAYKKKIKAELSKFYKEAITEVKEELKKELQSQPELFDKMSSLVDLMESKMSKKLEGEDHG